MESIANTSMTGCARPRVVTSASAVNALMRTLSGLRTLRTPRTVPGYVATQGTGVSSLAPTTVKANALLPISDVVVFGDAAGIRSWSPPV